jgi:hypothetical protein
LKPFLKGGSKMEKDNRDYRTERVLERLNGAGEYF